MASGGNWELGIAMRLACVLLLGNGAETTHIPRLIPPSSPRMQAWR
jgi:hypothetical protein